MLNQKNLLVVCAGAALGMGSLAVGQQGQRPGEGQRPGQQQTQPDRQREMDRMRQGQREGQGILDKVKSDQQFSTLARLIQAADLELEEGKQYTLLAPTNEAFRQMDPSLIEQLTMPENRETLELVLKHHIIEEQLDERALQGKEHVKTLAGQRLKVGGESSGMEPRRPGQSGEPGRMERPGEGRPGDAGRPGGDRPGETGRPGQSGSPGEETDAGSRPTPRPGESGTPGESPRPGESGTPGESSRPGEGGVPGERTRPGQTDRGGQQGELRIGDATVTQAGIEASDGVIHAVDAVLLPVPANLLEVAQEAGSFNVFVQLVRQAGLEDRLTGEDEYTLFVPSDQAFQQMGQQRLQQLLQDPDELEKLLQNHIVEGRVYSDEAVRQRLASTLADEELRVSQQGEQMRVNDASVQMKDIEAKNGVIHVIDSVLAPGSEGRTERPVEDREPARPGAGSPGAGGGMDR